MIKTIPKKKKCKNAKWLSEEALQIAVKRREEKSKEEKERYKHLNAEFQRIARRDKKAFFSHQCKEIEENNRVGKTRDLFKKIRDTKGTFHAKMVCAQIYQVWTLTSRNLRFRKIRCEPFTRLALYVGEDYAGSPYRAASLKAEADFAQLCKSQSWPEIALYKVGMFKRYIKKCIRQL